MKTDVLTSWTLSGQHLGRNERMPDIGQLCVGALNCAETFLVFFFCFAFCLLGALIGDVMKSRRAARPFLLN